MYSGTFLKGVLEFKKLLNKGQRILVPTGPPQYISKGKLLYTSKNIWS